MSKISDLIAKLCPNGVEYLTLRDCLTTISNVKWRECKGKQYRYIDLSSVNRDTHQIEETVLIDEGNAPSRAQQIVKADDIILGTTRPMLKRYCRIPKEFDGQICSTGFCVLRANDKALSGWLLHNISSSRFFDYVEKHQKGASYPAISDAEVLNFILPVPPLELQREVVEVLDKFALLTAELTAELEKRKKQYEHYRRVLLAEGNREQGIGNRCGVSNWPMVKLGEVCGSVSPSVKIKRLDYRETGLTPIVSQEIEYISGYCDLSDDKIPAGEYVCFGDHSEHIKYVNFAFVQGADGLKILKAKGGRVMAKFLYYVALAYYQRHDNYERHFKYFSETLVPLPPLAEQERIVKILDRFDKLCNDLTSGLPAEIAARKKQYEYYRDKLLSFKRAG